MRRRQRRRSDEGELAIPLDIRRQDAELAHELIAQRAYELFERRGRQEGRDLEDWFEAERELLSQERRLVS